MKEDFYSLVHKDILIQKGKKRKACNFGLLRNNEKQIFSEVRKIGNIEIYVDSPERKNYLLNDYARYIET